MRIETLLNPEYWILNTRAARRGIRVVAGLAEAGAVLLLFLTGFTGLTGWKVGRPRRGRRSAPGSNSES